MIETTDSDTPERLRARARHYVYERLALTSAVIWTLGTFVLMVTIVPYVPRPQKYIMVASLLPLVPAALPWLFWGLITDAVVRRWSQTPKE